MVAAIPFRRGLPPDASSPSPGSLRFRLPCGGDVFFLIPHALFYTSSMRGFLRVIERIFLASPVFPALFGFLALSAMTFQHPAAEPWLFPPVIFF